jgi:predicted ATP-dependent serine protease
MSKMNQTSTLPLEQQMFLNPETGRMVNYKGALYRGLIPSVSKQPKEKEEKKIDVKVETVRMSDLNFDDNIFTPISTGDENLDQFISSEGGFMPATNIILIGTPGIGKSTIGLNFLVRAQEQGKKVLFISGEMQRIDMYRYCKRFPAFNDLDIFFVSDYIKSDPVQAIEKVLENGYDLVLMDSWAEVSRTIKDYSGMSVSKAESWILDLFERHNEGNNKSKSYTCFLIIQQVTKSGEFVGSNRLKHMTTGMLEMYRDRAEGVNVMEFSKNRVGQAGERMTFRIEKDNVSYNQPYSTEE